MPTGAVQLARFVARPSGPYYVKLAAMEHVLAPVWQGIVQCADAEIAQQREPTGRAPKRLNTGYLADGLFFNATQGDQLCLLALAAASCSISVEHVCARWLQVSITERSALSRASCLGPPVREAVADYMLKFCTKNTS